MNTVEFDLRAHFPQEVKDIFDVADALLPAANNLLPPHPGSHVAADSWDTVAVNSVSFHTRFQYFLRVTVFSTKGQFVH